MYIPTYFSNHGKSIIRVDLWKILRMCNQKYVRTIVTNQHIFHNRPRHRIVNWQLLRIQAENIVERERLGRLLLVVRLAYLFDQNHARRFVHLDNAAAAGRLLLTGQWSASHGHAHFFAWRAGRLHRQGWSADRLGHGKLIGFIFKLL